MLELNELLGEGGARLCYFHPTDERLCVKVNKVEGNKQTSRERKYYKRLKRKGVELHNFIAPFVGMIETNLGLGGVYEIVKDYTGETSKTLDWYLRQPNLSGEFIDKINRSISAFKNKLETELVVTMNICPSNLVVKLLDENRIELVIIDDIGSPVLIPLEYYIKYIAHAKIQRKWKRFELLLQEKYNFRIRP